MSGTYHQTGTCQLLPSPVPSLELAPTGLAACGARAAGDCKHLEGSMDSHPRIRPHEPFISWTGDTADIENNYAGL